MFDWYYAGARGMQNRKTEFLKRISLLYITGERCLQCRTSSVIPSALTGNFYSFTGMTGCRFSAFPFSRKLDDIGKFIYSVSHMCDGVLFFRIVSYVLLLPSMKDDVDD